VAQRCDEGRLRARGRFRGGADLPHEALACRFQTSTGTGGLSRQIEIAQVVIGLTERPRCSQQQTRDDQRRDALLRVFALFVFFVFVFFAFVSFVLFVPFVLSEIHLQTELHEAWWHDARRNAPP
jgi:hypothetical protein